MSEKFLFNTVRLEQLNGASGTGFFFCFQINNKKVPVLITNKHVVNFNPDEKMRFFLHLRNDDGSTTENYNVEYTTKWFFHSTKDVCFTYVQPLFTEVKRITGKEVFFIPIDETIIYDQVKLENLQAMEEVVMVGYPSGLWDMKHNFPVLRRGFTAAHPAYDFNDDGIGLVDIASFPGSSGSPIFIFNEHGYDDKKGNYILESRVIFLGILFAGPIMNAQGKVVLENIPLQRGISTQTKIMINLGYYIKAHELQEFINIIKQDLSV